MDNGGGKPPASGESEKQLPVSSPMPSSFISASDVITAEVYQANAHQIQEAKEKIRRLEFNNESAHRNFLLNQLEKRAKDGREAENILAQLRSQPGLPPTLQFTNNVASGKSVDILPTTATLVEVPDSRSSPLHSPSAPATSSKPPQNVQRSPPINYQWGASQIQPHYSSAFRHYAPPIVPLQHNMPHPQASFNTTNRYMARDPPSRPMAHNPSLQASFQSKQAQQPVQSWINYFPPVVVPSDVGITSGYYTSSGEWSKTAPGHTPPSFNSSNPTFRGQSVSTQPVTFRPPVTVNNQPLNTTSVPYQSVPVVAMNPSVQHTTGSHSMPPEPLSQPISTSVSNTIAVSELQRPRQLSEQHRQHQQQSQPQAPQRPPQPSIQLQRVRQSQQSQRPPQSQQQSSTPPTDRVPSPGIPQPHSRSHQPHTTIVPEQASLQGTHTHQVDQATFIKHFHDAVQRGLLPLKAFWCQAQASGVSEEWFRLAASSAPQDAWNAVVAQANKLGPALNTTSPANAPQSQVSTNPSSSTAATPLGRISTTQQATKSNATSKADSASGTSSESYASQMQYYAQQATQSAHLMQTAGTLRTPKGNSTPAQITVTTPEQNRPQLTTKPRTPRDANKSTLARDVLLALGKIAPNPSQGMGDELADKVDNHEEDKLPEDNHSRSISLPASVEPPVALLEAVPVDANPPLTSSASPHVQNVPQGVISSVAKPVLKAEPGKAAADEGPIMIDLTLEDSDESIDGKGQEPDFLMQTSTSAVVSSRPVAPVSTTNLLEIPFIEELAVTVTGNSDNADVRMGNTSLATVIEEDTVPQPVYPLLGRAEPVSQSFEPLPSERDEDEQLPLFLPSPPASPVPTEPPPTDLEILTDEDETGPPLKRYPADVDKMQIDGGTMTPRVKKRRRQQVYVLIPPAPPYVKKAKMKGRIAEGSSSDVEEVGQDEEPQYTPLEQLMIEESQSCLSERRCRWSNCGAILNSGANLLAHLRNHAREEEPEGPFHCRWGSCQRRFGMEQERDVHLKRHTTKPLPCPFAGCDKQFDKPVEAMQHEVQHQKTERRELLVRKPTGQPVVPGIPARLGPPPHRLPSHRVIARRVAKCQISADRHAVVGPWVLWNIFSPVDLNMRKQNASMRGRPVRQANNYEVDSYPRRDDYDFLLAISPSPAKDVRLDDLDSEEMTMSAARGLTLWGRPVREGSAERHEEE